MIIRDAIRASLIRTVVPLIVGVIGVALLRFGITINDATTASYVTVTVSFVYYFLVRFAEQKWPRLSVLLGSRFTPGTYVDTRTVAAAPPPPPVPQIIERTSTALPDSQPAD